ncbi:DUF418 domain-containing protein [Microtetraspora sp. NBRC 16547]|uniref:DUF418 domain-containing protein n=1 Tax=Microtetraspora sp. NBRC 16547 TaxID=3030993 RepID=UPI0024A337C2|nr:DUF418 domain-containing protein [Microtetraspora sp. NBRC 16547]GLW98471.1 hypothetical protein Misp02_25580 [Microtetraspora sp. NBRC 16547]
MSHVDRSSSIRIEGSGAHSGGRPADPARAGAQDGPAPAPPGASPGASPGRPRIAALDVVRGVALCGILLANVQPIASVVDLAAPGSAGGLAEEWMGLLVEQRFFPIFSLLFGIGFSLLLESAGGRVAHPRRLLLRRLLILLAMGVAHFLLLWRGDILSTYAVMGLLVLLPSTWLPRWAVAALSPVFFAASWVMHGDRFLLIAGLFLVGSALTRYGVVDRIERSTRVPAALGLVFAVAAAPALWWQITSRTDGTRGLWSSALSVSGTLLAGLYVCAILVLLRTPLRAALQVVFAPLGRMALTNYLTATVLVLVAARLFGVPVGRSWTAMFLTAGVILALQWVWSTLWLRRYRFGPLEWLWRWATWGRRPPLRALS